MESTKQPKIIIKQSNSTHDESLQEAPIEEHFILRLPLEIKKEIEKDQQILAQADKKNNNISTVFEKYVNIQMKENSRIGKFTFKNKQFNCVLLDLPCITESLKTIDNKQFYKVADISQVMLVKSDPIHEAKRDFQHEHGLTNPLRDVRTSRFRKRMSKKVIEIVESEVEKLLLKDFDAEEVRYETVDRRDEDEDELSELEETEEEEDMDQMDQEIQPEQTDKDEFDLAAAIDEALDNDQSDESEEDDDEEEEQQEEDDDDETNEIKILQKSLKQEIQILTTKLAEKVEIAEKQVNAIMKERFMGIVNKLQMEIEHKKEQLAKLDEEENQ